MIVRILLIFISFTFVDVDCLDSVVCNGVDMRNEPMWWRSENFSKCTIIDGDMRILLMTNDTQTDEDFEKISFPNVVEITGSLIVFQVSGLTSLKRLLPNLRIIRGDTLLNEYALVLFQNSHFKEIGLSSLTEITHGGVRIEENPQLCYANTIDWTIIVKDKRSLVLIENKNPNECVQTCSNGKAISKLLKFDKDDTARACWNPENRQLKCPEQCLLADRACNDSLPGSCCHEQCSAGCTGPTDKDCYACRFINHNGTCLTKCPDNYFELNRHRCVSKSECHSLPDALDDEFGYIKFKAFNGVCSFRCPKDHQENPQNAQDCVRCHPSGCLRKCTTARISSADDAVHLKDCNIMNGELVISAVLETAHMQKIAEYLENIIEVRDNVQISSNPALTSVSILKNLRVIKGEKLYVDKYAISIVGNDNMIELLANNSNKIHIENGNVQIQNNPMLCYRSLEDIKSVFNINSTKTTIEASPISNGYKAICGVKNIALKLAYVTSDTVVASWEEINSSVIDMRNFLHFEMRVGKVESEYDKNQLVKNPLYPISWKSIVYDPDDRGCLITALSPYTLYALHLKVVMVITPESEAQMSQVVFFQTKSDVPSAVLMKSVESKSSDSIEMSWEAPKHPNGKISHYSITYYPMTIVVPPERNYCEYPPKYMTDKNDGEQILNDNQHCSKVCNFKANVDNSKAINEKMTESAPFVKALHNVIFINSRKRRSIQMKNNDHVIATTLRLGQKSINVTGLEFTLTGLKHFTTYGIKIIACQNESDKFSFCSQQVASFTQRTQMIEAIDRVDESSISLTINDKSSGRILKWAQPADPNGAIVAYQVVYNKMNNVKPPVLYCVNISKYEENGGLVFNDLNDGFHSMKIRSISLAQNGPWTNEMAFNVMGFLIKKMTSA